MPAAAGVAPAQAQRLLPLRDELQLHPGPRGRDGGPSWTVEDPAANRYVRLGWAEFEMLSHWHLGEPGAIAAAVRATTTIDCTAEMVEAFGRFLAGANLLQIQGETAIERLRKQEAARRVGAAKWLLKNYLFIRLPLVRPAGFLRATLPLVGWIYSGGFALLALLSALVGGLLVARQWDDFVNTVPQFFTAEGMVLAALTLAGAKLVHELGHAYTATRYGCAVPSMGICFLVLWPVLYTDTTSAWRLVSRRQRLAIGAAGMAAELVLAAFATLAWALLPDGPWRGAAFVLASTTWVLTLLVNLNPLMRFDGYFLLSDWLDVPNLQERAFALARWRLREALFGLGDPPPEHFPPRMALGLTVFAFAVWVYRFFLFLGIALVVYHLFFKLLGLLLFAVEIGWFIVRPIVMELRDWARRREQLRLNRQLLVALAGLAGLVALAFVPWRGTVAAPALLRAAAQAELFVPVGAQLRERLVAEGQRVEAGQPLFRFGSPDLEHRIAQTEREIAQLRWQASLRGGDAELLRRSRVVQRELAGALATQDGLLAEQALMTVAAPIAGTVTDLASPLAVGEWLARDVPLGMVADRDTAQIVAYVAESDLGRIAPGAAALFVPDEPEAERRPARVAAIDDAGIRQLADPLLASIHGGPLPTRTGPNQELVPEGSYYRVVLTVDGPAPARQLRGRLFLDGEAQSFAVRLWRAAVAVVVRESGF